MQRFIGVVLGGTVTFALLLLTSTSIVADQNKGYLISVVVGGIVSWLWPWVIGWILVRRARQRQQDTIQAEVARQVAEETTKGQ